MGVQAVFTRCLGTVPGPILFGYVIDTACRQWQDSCGEQGSCWVYKNSQLSRNVTILGVLVKIFSTLFFSLAAYFYKAPSSANTMTKSYTMDHLNEVSEPKENGFSNYQNHNVGFSADNKDAGFTIHNSHQVPSDNGTTTKF